MICYRCGMAVGKSYQCPHCGASMTLFVRAKHISNAYYNEGLQKAKVRNLSGAVISLKASLRFDKYNTKARNLLGLIYYETGEIVDAISEWVISKNFEPKDNDATRYLDDIQENETQLDAINSTIKKYNQALLYCKQDSRDLAIIQLKKVLSLNPKLVKAHQLLALLYLQEDKLDLAKKTLRDAGKIDTDNTTTLRYLREVNKRIKENGKNKKQPTTDELISYQSGNDTIIMPKRFRETSLAQTVVSIVIGLVVGICVTCFLVVPNVKSKAKAEATKSLLSANDTISSNGLTITDLEAQVEELQSELDGLNSDEDSATSRLVSYKALIAAYAAANSGDTTEATTLLAQVDSDDLDETAQEVFNMTRMFVDATYLEEVYQAGKTAYNSEDYETAAQNLQLVITVDRDYAEDNVVGAALYYLADSYYQLAQVEEASEGSEAAATYYALAKEYFTEIQSDYPNTTRATLAAEALGNIAGKGY